jgi:hypothetical protein
MMMMMMMDDDDDNDGDDDDDDIFIIPNDLNFICHGENLNSKTLSLSEVTK